MAGKCKTQRCRDRQAKSRRGTRPGRKGPVRCAPYLDPYTKADRAPEWKPGMPRVISRGPCRYTWDSWEGKYLHPSIYD